MQKYRLFAPGPTPVPESVLLTMAHPVLHHRTPAAEQIFARVREGLRWIFQTRHEVLTLVGSGTAAMESAVCNLLAQGDTAIYVNGGKFGERWGELLSTFGARAVEIKVPWGQGVDPQQVRDALCAHPEARGVFLQGCETSTGAVHPVKEVASICARYDCLSVVDGITWVGVSDVSPERDGIDVLISGAQKAFMLPPGLAFITMGPRAWAAQQRSQGHRFYFDLKRVHDAAQKNQSAWTSAVSLIAGLDESLRLMRIEGLPGLFERHRRLAAMTRAGACALGCELFARAPSDGVTSLVAPEGVKAQDVKRLMHERFNITIAEGQDAYKEKIFRVAHMGYFDDLDMLTLLSALESCLATLGARSPDGAGVAAALKIMHSKNRDGL